MKDFEVTIPEHTREELADGVLKAEVTVKVQGPLLVTHSGHGWTRGREIQCGCGWEGEHHEVLWVCRMVEKFVNTTLVRLPHVTAYQCPECRADVTEQAWAAGFKITIHRQDWMPVGKVFERYKDKKLKSEYYRAIELNGDRDERRHC